MSEKWDNKTVGEYIMDEGIGYAIRNGLSADNIEDKYLAKLWVDADMIMDKIVSYLKEVVPELDDYV